MRGRVAEVHTHILPSLRIDSLLWMVVFSDDVGTRPPGDLLGHNQGDIVT